MNNLFSIALFTTVASALDYPGNNCCQLFGRENYAGASVKLCIGGDVGPEGQWFNLEEEGFDDSMYSYWCGSKITYEFGWDYPGDYHGQDYGFSGAGNTKNPSIWLEPDWIFGGISKIN